MDYGCIVWGDCGKQNALHQFFAPRASSKRSYAWGKSQDLYTIHAIETNAAINKQQKTVHEITTCVQNH